MFKYAITIKVYASCSMIYVRPMSAFIVA